MVYFILCTETGRVKIGYTRRTPEERLEEMQMYCPTKLALVAQCHEGTLKSESFLHEKFKKHRLHGEWFTVEAWRGMWIMHARGERVPV